MAKMKRRHLAALGIPAGLIAAGLALERSGWLYVWFPQLAPPALVMVDDGQAQGRLLRVRDGDTVEVRYHDLALAVRLRNLDTEESVHPEAARNTELGAETSDWAKRTLDGQRVWLQFQRTGWRIAMDHHGRALATLWIDHGEPGPDEADRCFQELVIRRGYSRYETGFGPADGSLHQRYQAAEAAARAERLGIWATDR